MAFLIALRGRSSFLPLLDYFLVYTFHLFFVDGQLQHLSIAIIQLDNQIDLVERLCKLREEQERFLP